MHSLTKRYNKSPSHSQSSYKQQNVSKSSTKKFNTISRSPSLEDEHEKQVKKLMTSNAYNNVFNRLIKLNDLKEFVKQSAQYVQFHQQEVKNFIPVGQNDKRRFSFSLKTSIYSFITKDYRFLRHYFTLLQKQFPQKKDKLRQEIFQQFKDKVIDRKKFYTYFSSTQISKSFKSLHKPIKSTTLIKKIMKNQTLNYTQSSIMKEKIKHNKTPEKLREGIHFHSKDRIYEISKQKFKTTHSKQIKLQNQSTKKSMQNNANSINLQLRKQRRTTMQNIKIIEDTLNEIQLILSQSSPSKNRTSQKIKHNNIPKIKNQDQSQVIYQQSLNLQPNTNICIDNVKTKEEKYQSITQTYDYNTITEKRTTQNQAADELVQNQDEIYEKLISRRTINKSKKKKEQSQDDRNIRLLGIQNSKYKSSIKKQRKIVPFSQVFDVNDPDNKQILTMIENFQKQRQKQTKKKEEKQKTTNELLKKIRLEVSIFKKEVRRQFNQREKQLLTPEESIIVNLFPQIKQIGGFNHFQYDRDCFLYTDLGQFKGFRIEQVLSWPKVDKYDEAFKCLYLTKLKNEQQKDQNQRKFQSIDELKMKLLQNKISDVTLLIIEK